MSRRLGKSNCQANKPNPSHAAVAPTLIRRRLLPPPAEKRFTPPLPDTVRFLYANFKSIYQEDLRSEKLAVKNESDAAQALAKPPPSIFLSGEDSPETVVQDDCIAVLTYAPNPFREFRRSMAEMVEVRLGRGEKVDWDFLEEMLFRYLDLNNEKAHRNILRAFVDLVVVLHENEWRFPEQRR